ncbi:Phytanoyl-CoA dioxygenase (PhyH) [Geosmithia morbida]|uniref:Phytanoyl-CoA dioxygenase (PhyH) n=1 Tax=Geosmithia morbida TaxID=1094350 RepID=A0A9P4YVQ1_9HYPO|nr:Phytanoyl-CoA dioxygenase (PhyH) [Geosmithia morbida]KAF4122905.1 Phytanoyl-CoA dioxygenase (PhyH) [Geosmithia morbida]
MWSLHAARGFRSLKGCIRGFAAVQRPGRTGCVSPSASEIANAKLGSRNLEKAVRHLHKDGLVVIEDVVPHEHLDILNEKMVKDARTLQARGEDGPFNYNLANLQQDAPPVAKYFFPSIFTNNRLSIDPIGTQVTTAILGPRPKWTFCSANAAMPLLPGASPQRQPVHTDADFAHPSHPFALVVNVPLITMTPENGSTELWLGTHTGHGLDSQEGSQGDRASGRIKENLLREREVVNSPVQPVVKKGSIIVRDLRLWHAGMPNMSDEVRMMLAMIHFAPWFRNKMRLEFGRDICPILEKLENEGNLGLEVPVDWVEVDMALGRYLNRGFGNSYNFSQEA